MKAKMYIKFFMVIFLSYTAHVFAVNNPPDNAAVVNLRVNCIEGSTEVLNCFDNLSIIDNWMNNVRTSPSILVQVGPGIFTRESTGSITGAINCSSSNITIRGSGRENSTINTNFGRFPSAGIHIKSGCNNLDVQDIKISGWLQGAVVTELLAVTSWTNVELTGGTYGWFESGSCPINPGKHSWFSSRIIATGETGGSITYTAACAESWFWGSQITANNNGTGAIPAYAIQATQAEIHLYGSNIRLLTPATVNADGADVVRALNNSEIHIHGTGIDISHNGSGTISFLNSDISSAIHAFESAFSIQNSGQGQITRITGTGKISSSYNWGARTEPPIITSKNGYDSYTEIDCPISNNCGSGGDFPHMMIYREECTGQSINQGPWYDTVTKLCRQ